jgi:hypothetical protein
VSDQELGDKANLFGLPSDFRELLWSYDFEQVDPEVHKKTVILSAIRYGKLFHWRWVIQYYGKDTVRECLSGLSETELAEGTRKLVIILLDLKGFQHAPRGTD